MAKDNQKGPQKQTTNPTRLNTTGTNKGDFMVQPTTNQTVNKSKPGKKTNRPQVGGTAVTGAKSTQPKEISTTNNPQQQQAESYNRTMRRRMEQMGTGPSQANTVQDQRKKRLDKRRKRIEERRQEVKKVAAGGPRKISIGRRNTYFLIAVVVIIIAIIIIAAFINGRL